MQLLHRELHRALLNLCFHFVWSNRLKSLWVDQGHVLLYKPVVNKEEFHNSV